MAMYMLIVLLCTTVMLETVTGWSLNLNQEGSVPEGDDGSLTDDEEDVLLDAHNYFRRISNANSMPQAADMELVTWDDDLADEAQSWADQCVWGHPTERYLADGRLYGQNLVMAMPRGESTTYPNYRMTSNLTLQVEVWYNEVHDYTWPTSCSGVCGHYTQLMWSTSSLVGCAAQNCHYTNEEDSSEEGVGRVVVCNYYKAGNGGSLKPYYASNAPCVQCPSDKPACVDGLCAPLRNEDGDCMQTCQNGGEPDSDTCECQCADGYYNTYFSGTMCQRQCMDYSTSCYVFNATNHPDYCVEATGVSNFSSTLDWRNVQYWCPQTCELCG